MNHIANSRVSATESPAAAVPNGLANHLAGRSVTSPSPRTKLLRSTLTLPSRQAPTDGPPVAIRSPRAKSDSRPVAIRLNASNFEVSTSRQRRSLSCHQALDLAAATPSIVLQGQNPADRTREHTTPRSRPFRADAHRCKSRSGPRAPHFDGDRRKVSPRSTRPRVSRDKVATLDLIYPFQQHQIDRKTRLKARNLLRRGVSRVSQLVTRRGSKRPIENRVEDGLDHAQTKHGVPDGHRPTSKRGTAKVVLALIVMTALGAF